MDPHGRDGGWRADTLVEMSGASLLSWLVFKLENNLPFWTEAKRGGIILKSLTWDYIGRPAWWLEIIWGYTGIFERL